MRGRFWAVQALALGTLCAAAACFPDPPPDDGILDSGIFLSDSSLPSNDGTTASGLTLSATTLDFGLAECGGVAPPTQKLTLTNTSSGPVTYGAAASGNDFALVSPATGTIPAGGSSDLVLSSTGVSPFATAGGVIEGALQVVTNAPGQKLFVVDLKKTAAGAQLVMIPREADFGLLAAGDVGALDVGFRNNGNLPLDITFDDAPSTPFALELDNDAGVTFSVPGGSTKTLHATYTAEVEPTTLTQVIGFHTTGVLCGGGDPPSSVVLNASWQSSGYADIQPGILAFDQGGTGFVPCGQTAKPQTVSITNPVGGVIDPITIIGTTVTGPFTVLPYIDFADAGAGINVAAGTTQKLTVTPSTVTAPASTAPEGQSGTLQILLSNDQSLTVTLSQTAQGAQLSFAPTSLDFGSTAVDALSQKLFGVTNTGNAPVGITLAISGSPFFTVSPSAQFSINTPGGTSTVSFLPLATGAAQATMTMQVSGAVCSMPSPATVLLTGNGTTPAPDAGSDAGGDAGDAGDGGLVGDAALIADAGL